jgi:lipopolysaccharide export system protein LptC
MKESVRPEFAMMGRTECGDINMRAQARMNDPAPPGARRDRLNAIGVARENAVPEAIRHSARVARLRPLMLWSAGGIIGLVLIGLAFQALRFLPMDLRFARVGLKGSRITIESPKLVGYRKDGRPYELRAKVGIQDMATPDVFELHELEVRMDDGDKVVVLSSDKGVYNTKLEHADLSGGVRIHDDKQFDMNLESAEMDFTASVMSSDRPVTLKIENGEVVAKSVEFSQKERRATFTGDVHSVLYGDSGGDAAGDQPPQQGE